MTEQQIWDAMIHHKFLQEMPRRHLQTLATGASVVNLAPETFLCRQGQPAESFFLILTGSIAIQSRELDPRGVRLQTVGPGEPVGWSWLIPPHRWQFDCQALDTTQCLAFDAAWLRTRCEEDHDLGYHLLKRLVATISGRLTANRLASFQMNLENFKAL